MPSEQIRPQHTAELTYRIATEPWQFEAIHRLNYQTFVEEIPQHDTNAEQRLVDKFHAENTYCICVRGQALLGMVCLRSARPFSLDQKLPNLDALLPAGKSLCEIRLLAVVPDARHSRVTMELFRLLARQAIEQGYDLGIMSGTTRQLKLYARIGFVPFGPLVGQGDATYQPMYLSLPTFLSQTLSLLKFPASQPIETVSYAMPVSFLPGPVTVKEAVREAMAAAPMSHRASTFSESLRAVKRELISLTNARHVALLLGTGTLANDMVAAQLKLQSGRGVVFSNGEFGNRLIDHATRQQLEFDVVKIGWGQSFNVSDIAQKLDQLGNVQWLWMTHCETSSGVLNDIVAIGKLCHARGIWLCLDCISSLGVVPLDLSSVWLATGVSGKGLAAYPGLSMVFHNHAVSPAPQQLPRYLDLGLYGSHSEEEPLSGETPFTHSSNLVDALNAALNSTDWVQKFAQVSRDGLTLQRRLHESGFHVVADPAHAAPAVVTIELPPHTSAFVVGKAMDASGFLLSYRSAYLREQNWLQVCLMGAYEPAALRDLVATLIRAVTNPASFHAPCAP
jgi:aspartate aminotransferase-like enzyme/N-acyl-L-homoserine lactone synthetase